MASGRVVSGHALCPDIPLPFRLQHHSKRVPLSAACLSAVIHLARQLWSGLATEHLDANRFGVLAAWTIVGSLLAWPDYLAYFNEFIGGPRNGYHWLGDSNVDWGQDLKGLKRFMVQHGIDRIGLSYFGTADPAHYGIEYEYLPSANSGLRPTPPLHEGEMPSRFVAFSAYQYQGIDFPDKDFYRILLSVRAE